MAPTMENQDDVSDFVVHKGNGIKGLVDNGLQNLPSKYIQPLEDRFDVNKALSQVTIPVIDISNLNDDPKIAEAICEAASKWGFFQIINHGIPLEDMDDLQNSVHEFFGLSNEERRKYLKENSPDKSVFMSTSFSPNKETVLEWKDFLSFNYLPENDLDELSSHWPPACKNQVVRYMKKTDVLIKKLLEVLLKKLNIKEITEEKASPIMGKLIVNLNYYPKCPNPELTVGNGPHSDISTITVLLQDEVGGLFIRELEGNNWIHIPPVKGALVINVGDTLQILSNGKYKSIEHRVVANKKSSRVSVPIFVIPAPNAIIGPLSETLEGGATKIYKEISFSDYFQYYFSKGHDGKKTIDFVTIN